MKIFAPYLSKTLLHRIDLAHACSRDWNRQHPDPNVKPEVAWFEAESLRVQDKRTNKLPLLRELKQIRMARLACM